MPPLRRALHGVLRGWYAGLLARLGADLAQAELARARSWVDARRRLSLLADTPLPSQLLERLADPEQARPLLTEIFAPPGFGTALGRYASRLERLAGLLGDRPRARLWDVGTATGEGLWELVAAASARCERVDALGTDRCPMQLAMARARVLPHAPARAAALAELLSGRPALTDPRRCSVRFERHDVTAAPPEGPWDVIACHGVVGESVRGREAVVAVVRGLGESLAPMGLLSLTDTFRDDHQREARAWVSAADLPALGLSELEPGLFQRG
jgi:hypothetical protein